MATISLPMALPKEKNMFDTTLMYVELSVKEFLKKLNFVNKIVNNFVTKKLSFSQGTTKLERLKLLS